MPEIRIAPGGTLIRREWVYDDEKEEGAYVETDVTDEATTFLFYPECTIQDDVTLRDVFLLLQRDLWLYKVIINNWVEEIVAEGLLPCDEPNTEVEYLELYHFGEIFDDEMGGLHRLEFHGKGFEDNDGTRTGWGLVCPSNEIAHLPVRLHDRLIVYDDITERCNLPAPGATLGAILFGIIYELSWYGPPEKRDWVFNDMHEAIEEIKAGRERLKVWKKTNASQVLSTS